MKAWRTMTRMTILRTTSLTKTNIEFDFRENDYDTTRHGYASRADRSVETVSDSPDEELGKANAIS